MTHSTRLLLALAGAGLGLATPSQAELGTPVLQWQRCATSFCDTGWYASPAVVSIAGVPHVLGGGYRLIAVRGDTGTLAWTYPAAGSPGRMWPGVAVADLDEDGAREIVVVQHDDVAVLDTSGAVQPGWPQSPFGSAEMRTLAVADLDGDGAHEILTARASGGSYDTWTVLEPNGATRPGWPRLDSLDAGYAWGAYNQNLAVADLDADGDLEVAASSDVHYLAAFADDGTPLPANAIYGAGENWSQVGVHYDHAVDLRGYANCGIEHRPNFADAPPAIGDLDGDGSNEIVVVGSFYDCDSPTYQQLFQVPIVLEVDRTRWASGAYDWTALPVPDANAAPLAIDYEVIESAEANPALADLDGDGEKEIVHASYDGRVHAWWLDRSEHGVWPFDVNLGSTVLRFASEPAVADLDGDGDAEVLFATWTAKGSNQRGDLFIVDAQGHELFRVPLPASAQSWDGALAAPTVAQLDADPAIEVIVNTAHTGLVAYEIPGSVASAPRWPTGRGNFTRSAPEADRILGLLAALATLGAAHRRSRSRSSHLHRPQTIPART